MVLLTATPHSGDEEAFGRLLSLLDPSFASMNFDDAEYRERLARHFVQRRRDRSRPRATGTRIAPSRSTRRRNSPTACRSLTSISRRRCWTTASDVVDRAGSGQRERRLAFWGTLALMRCVGSSPAAALSALRNRVANEIDRLEPQIYDEDGDDEDAVDIEPSADLRRRSGAAVALVSARRGTRRQARSETDRSGRCADAA